MLAVPMALGAAPLAWVRGDAWKARALDTVNAQLEGDLLVDDIALSWWNGFPTSVDLAQIAVTNAQNDTLIQAQRVGLELDVWSLLSETPDIHAITLEDGRLHLAQDVRGSWNVQALLRNADDAPDQTPTLSLAQVKLQNMALSVGLKEGLAPPCWCVMAPSSCRPTCNPWLGASNCPKAYSTRTHFPNCGL